MTAYDSLWPEAFGSSDARPRARRVPHFLACWKPWRKPEGRSASWTQGDRASRCLVETIPADTPEKAHMNQ